MNILVHTSFIGDTGYANHARSFFCALNKYHNVKVRNLTIGSTWKGMTNSPHDKEPYFTEEMRSMLILQTLTNSDGSRTDFPLYGYKDDFKPDVHIVLNDVHNPYFYDEYEGYKIAFNVWESTRYPDDFFQILLKFDEVWVPSKWQYDSLIEQGYPKNRISIVTEGVDITVFKPILEETESEKFRFLLFGRWEHRKSTTEIIRTFGETFKNNNKVELLCSVENPYPFDGLKTTDERIKRDVLEKYKNVKYVNFPSREEYVNYLQEGEVFVSCARSEGWNLPLCVPEGKLVFSNNRFIPIENIKENDIVVSHTGDEQKVIETFKREYIGDVINIKLFNDHELLTVTPSHPVYAIKRNKFITKKNKFKNLPNIKPEWIESKEIRKGDIILRTTIKEKYLENEIIDMITFDDRLKYDSEKVWYNTGYNKYGEQIKYNRFVRLYDLSYLFGWYIAEGCDGEYKLLFTLNALKEINVAEKILSEMFNIFGIKGTYRIIENRLVVSFGSVLLCKFFTYFCNKMSYNKKIPEKILLGPLDVLNELIKNMVLGDGHLSKCNHTSYTTVSQILGRQLMFANQRLGIKSTIQINKRHNRIEKRVCYVISWELNNTNHRHSNKSWWHPEGLAILVNKVNTIPYNGFVYNLEVENDNSYLMSNATVHNCEAMSCGTPAIYTNWGAQLQFAKDKGIPVKIKGLVDANIKDVKTPGQYCEPDYDDLAIAMDEVYRNYQDYKNLAMIDAAKIREEFNWDKVAREASSILEKRTKPFVFVTAGDAGYMPVIQKMVESLKEFSKSKVIVYGINCDVPFDGENVIRKRVDPPKHSIHDRWYWKQYACIESIKEDFERYVWIDGDVVANYNIDEIEKYFKELENYPLSDIHINDEFLGKYKEDGKECMQLFSQRLAELWGVPRIHPYMHACMYIYDKSCKWWFEEIINVYMSIDLKDYIKYCMWNDEGIDNALRWKYGFKKHLPVSNFDTSSYDGLLGHKHQGLQEFYKFWNEKGPQNFNRVYGYQFIPEDKSDTLYFHGNKDTEVSHKLIEFIKLQRDKNFYQSDCFYTDVYYLDNFENVKNVQGGTVEIANKYDWKRAIYHEIYNLTDYYLDKTKRIHEGDIVVDLGGNMGLFNRWAYKEGASKVISFEPDSRYFKLLKLNADPRSILFNAAVSDSMGTVTLHESEHFGGSNIFDVPGSTTGYKVRTYTLDYLFEAGLIDKIDFLKVDIEGAEIRAFNGISDENLKKVKTIAMEYHHGHLNYDDQVRLNFIERLSHSGFNSYLLFLGGDNALQMIYFWR